MRRLPLIILLAAVLAAMPLAAGCGGGTSSSASPSPVATSTSHTPVTITVWHPWTNPERQVFMSAVKGFHQKYPWITVKIVGFPVSDTFDQQLIKAINTGNGPDVAISFGPDYVGQYAASGLWQDLKPYMQSSDFSMSQFPAAALSYTSFQGKQVALPVLTDAYGLYYNKSLLAKAGITTPPKTMSELMADAQKLTVKNADGSIKIAGFVPLNNWEQLGPSDLSRAWGAKWFDDQGQPVLATDPGWASALTWQKQLVDWYGYDNLTKFYATYAPSEFDASNAFQNGKVALLFDGEWRTAFIKRYSPALNYGTAPFPAADDRSDLYGVGRVGGTIVGMPKGCSQPQAAWQFMQYVATDTDFLVQLANGLGNVPTTEAAASSPQLDLPPQFDAFVSVWNNPKSNYAPPLTSSGAGYASLLNTFDDQWVAGKVPDLQAGLAKVDKQISDQLSLSSAP
jgi:multiple sugar transport system substrate-binding protein